MLLIQVEKVLAIQTGKVLGRKMFLWPIAALHFFLILSIYQFVPVLTRKPPLL